MRSGTHALAPLLGDLTGAFAGVGTLCRIAGGLIRYRIAHIAHAVVILPDALVDAQQDPADGGQPTEHGNAVGLSCRRIEGGEQDALRMGDALHLGSALPHQPVLTAADAAALPDVHTVGRCRLQSGEHTGSWVYQHLPQRIAVGEQAVQIAVRKTLERLPRQSHGHLPHKGVQLGLKPSGIAHQPEIAGQPDDFSDGSVNDRNGSPQLSVEHLFLQPVELGAPAAFGKAWRALENAAHGRRRFFLGKPFHTRFTSFQG